MRILACQPCQWPGVVRLDYAGSYDDRPDWALVRPGARPDWVVVLHGHGSHGDQLYTRPDLTRWLDEFTRHGVGILTLNLRDNAWMNPAAVADLTEVMTWLRASYPVERTLFYSGSMGGTGNLIYAGLHPEQVDAVVVRGGAVDLTAYVAWLRQKNDGIQKEIADAIEMHYNHDVAAMIRHSSIYMTDQLTMPVYLLHGVDDALMPVTGARRFALAMAGKPRFHYREIPGGDHDSPLFVPIDFNYEVWQ